MQDVERAALDLWCLRFMNHRGLVAMGLLALKALQFPLQFEVLALAKGPDQTLVFLALQSVGETEVAGHVQVVQVALVEV